MKRGSYGKRCAWVVWSAVLEQTGYISVVGADEAARPGDDHITEAR